MAEADILGMNLLESVRKSRSGLVKSNGTALTDHASNR